MLSYSYIGVFGVSLLAGLVLFVPAPYFIPVALLGLDARFDPTMVALASAAGSTIAKTIIFRASYLGHRFIGEATKRRVRPFERLVARYGWFAAFFASATPMPDDVIYIPLGFARYNLWRFISATFIGKALLAAGIAWGARILGLAYIGWLVEPSMNMTAVIVTAIVVVIMTVLTLYAIVKLDWGRLLARWFPWTVADNNSEK